jgi:hypothetical protein
MQAYLFEGYWEDIGTIGAFYRSQLALLQPKPDFSMARFLPPSRVNVRSSSPLLAAATCRGLLSFHCVCTLLGSLHVLRLRALRNALRKSKHA